MNQALDEAASLGFPKIEEKHLKKAERLLPSSTRTHCLVPGKVEATRAITPVAWATDDPCQLKKIRKVKPMWHFFSATNLMDLQSYSKRMAEESKEVTMYIAFRGTAPNNGEPARSCSSNQALRHFWKWYHLKINFLQSTPQNIGLFPSIPRKWNNYFKPEFFSLSKYRSYVLDI